MRKLPNRIENEIPATGYLGNKEGTLDDNINIFDGPAETFRNLQFFNRNKNGVQCILQRFESQQALVLVDSKNQSSIVTSFERKTFKHKYQ